MEEGEFQSAFESGLPTRDEARRIAGQYRQAAELAGTAAVLNIRAAWYPPFRMAFDYNSPAELFIQLCRNVFPSQPELVPPTAAALDHPDRHGA
jgi:hypothetical protein